MNRQKICSAFALAAAVSLAACEDQLKVTNPNSGETERVLATPNDAEALLGTYYKRWHSGVYSGTGLEGMTNNFSLMNYSSLANNCQNVHLPFSNATNFNQPGNACAGDQARLFSIMGEVNRVAASFLGRMEATPALTLGSNARNARARSWAEFLNGLSMGYVALMHDSGAVVNSKTSPEVAPPLVSHKVLADSAIAALTRAIAEASKPDASAAGGFPIPNAWLPSPTVWTTENYIRLVRSYRARIRANVPRTAAERAAVNWAVVIDDAVNGIEVDHLLTTSTTVGPSDSWRATYDTYGLWHQMPPFFIGMADASGSYASWIATPLGDRGTGNVGFFMTTPDLRFPQGNTRAEQNADFNILSCQAAATVCKRYFVNRPAGADQYAGNGWAYSNYDFVRWHSWRVSGDAGSGQNGRTPFMMKAEIDMLEAEGRYRSGNFAAAAALVNKTRTKNGLPAITEFNASSPVPGGEVGCVPKIPVAPFNKVACGNLWEALKYEKRIETAYSHYSAWYLDSRGWGDLAFETPLFWAVPFGELQARGVPSSRIYGAGTGAGNAPNSFSVAKSTYGW